MSRLERGFAVKVARILNKASLDVAAEVRASGTSVEVNALLSWLEPEILSVFRPHYEVTIDVFGRRMLDAFKSNSGYNTKADDEFLALTERWVQTTAAEKVVQVSGTTKRQIRKAIEDSIAQSLDGEGMAETIMSKTGGVIAKNRAVVIARTETHMAAQFASQEAVRSTGIPAKRVWIAAADEATRTDHMLTDQESHADPVGMNEAFPVLGLMYPGDPSGAPEDVINCRCVVGYKTD